MRAPVAQSVLRMMLECQRARVLDHTSIHDTYIFVHTLFRPPVLARFDNWVGEKLAAFFLNHEGTKARRTGFKTDPCHPRAGGDPVEAVKFLRLDSRLRGNDGLKEGIGFGPEKAGGNVGLGERVRVDYGTGS